MPDWKKDGAKKGEDALLPPVRFLYREVEEQKVAYGSGGLLPERNIRHAYPPPPHTFRIHIA
jgi:hypothetical protein